MSLTGSGLNSMRSIPTFGTVGALSEIIDNSIQWRVEGKIANINVILIERGKEKTVKDIIITDNGQGMGDIIDTCLYFGGGTNHGATSNLGKFGVGLPYACCSQSRKYHVYSWQKKGVYKHVYRNHDDYKPNDLVVDKPHEIIQQLPKLFTETNPDLLTQESGTIVYWEDCDRVDPKMAKTIIKRLDELLGRTYRNFIRKDDININWKTYYVATMQQTPVKDNAHCSPIKINDPLRLVKSGTLLSDSPYNIPEGKHDIFDQVGEEIIIKSKPDPSLNEHIHTMKIKFSIAKKEIQRPGGNDGGDTDIGRLCNRSYGISLVRAGREIKLANFGYIMPNSADPRLRFMKIEASFEPISDNILNVNANKTDAINFRHMSPSEYEAYNIEGDGIVGFDIQFRYDIACVIQRLLQDAMKTIKERGKDSRKTPKTQKCPKCNDFSLNKGVCDNCGTIEVCPDHGIAFENGVCAICETIVTPKICIIHKEQLNNEGKCPKCIKPTLPLAEEEKKQLVRILKEYDIFKQDDQSIQVTIDWFVKSSKSHFLLFMPDDLNPNSFLKYVSYQGKFELIFVNTLHPFYKVHIHDHYLNGDEDLESLVLFIISWVNAENHYNADPSTKTLIGQFRSHFGLKLAENLAQWNIILAQSGKTSE
jgi:ribosomal protein L32